MKRIFKNDFKVKVKKWDDMAKKHGVIEDDQGKFINLEGRFFTEELEAEIPEDRIIEVQAVDDNLVAWVVGEGFMLLSEDMFERVEQPRETRIVKAVDTEDGWHMMLETNLTPKEIRDAIFNEQYDEDNLDYSMKCIRYAEENGLICRSWEIDAEVVEF